MNNDSPDSCGRGDLLSGGAAERNTGLFTPENAKSPAESAPAPSGTPRSLADRSFAGFLATQFFGAFNDNLFKQLLLLLAVPTAAAIAAGEGRADLQGVATVVFGLPFVIFGGLAGFIGDRINKRRIIIASKVAEIVVMGLGLVAFLAAPWIGFYGLWVVLFLMGMQSAFFGPGKYGILPEMLHRDQLSKANGLVLMTTFIAIIIGTALAGPLKDSVVASGIGRLQAAQQLWVGSLICVGIAVLGTVTSLWIRRVPPAAPEMKWNLGRLAVPRAMVRLLADDRPLLLALGASCAFWLIAGLAIQAVNSLGKTQLGLSDTKTSLMVSLISVGIAVGGVAAGWLARRLSDNFVIQTGMWGLVGWCVLLSVTLPGRGHLLGFGGSIPVLMLLGASAAFFAIPVQVFLQARPPSALKGQMIAVMNQANFLAIVIAGVLYQLLDVVINAGGLPRSTVFAVMAVLFVPVAILFRMDLPRPVARDSAPND